MLGEEQGCSNMKRRRRRRKREVPSGRGEKDEEEESVREQGVGGVEGREQYQ